MPIREPEGFDRAEVSGQRTKAHDNVWTELTLTRVQYIYTHIMYTYIYNDLTN